MNSIEKALQKQQEAEEALKKQQESVEQISAASRVQETASIPEQETISTIEKVQAHRQELKPAMNTEKTTIVNIDLNKLKAKGFVSTDTERLLINEEFRAIKRKVIENAFGALSNTLNNSNIIMVTSSRPSEGKTFTAVNLALSIALEQDKTVLLVDADVLRPNVMKTLELQNQEGLMEFLLGEKKDISDILCSTNVPNLRIIAAGKAHHLSTELLASAKMSEAVDEFANRYPDRIVIVDTPPLLGINETAVLANLAGQAIVVAEEGKTKLSEIQKAVSHLNPEMAIGFVVNKSQDSNSEGTGYGYYYGSSH
jgi:protein-tyrosine kinase